MSDIYDIAYSELTENYYVMCNGKKIADVTEQIKNVKAKERLDVIDEVKKCLALLLIKSDDIDYSFNDGHWGLVFSVFAKEFGLKDTEIYELEEQLKG